MLCAEVVRHGVDNFIRILHKRYKHKVGRVVNSTGIFARCSDGNYIHTAAAAHGAGRQNNLFAHICLRRHIAVRRYVKRVNPGISVDSVPDRSLVARFVR